MAKFFAGLPPAGNGNPGYGVLTIARAGNLASSAGIQGIDGGIRPQNWNLADNLENIVFDSRLKYLRRLARLTFQMTIAARGAESLTSMNLITTVTSQNPFAFCVGKVVGQPNHGIYAGFCDSNGTRLLSFSASTAQNGVNSYLTSVYLVDQYGGQSAPARTFSIDVSVFVT